MSLVSHAIMKTLTSPKLCYHTTLPSYIPILEHAYTLLL